MSLLRGSLEALLTPDDDPIGTPQGAAPLPHVNPVVWISFSGAPNDSVTSFIQSVQRAAFQHNQIENDKWIAQLASTCFTDTALVWYLGLEKETRCSWERLRIALVDRYLVQSAVQTPKPVTVPPQLKLSPTVPSSTDPKLGDTGIIEVLLPQFGDVLGYLSQDSMGKFVIDPDVEKALKLQKVLHTDSDDQHQRIYSLKLINALDPHFPFLGLKLVKRPREDPNVVPQWDRPCAGYGQNVPACCNIPNWNAKSSVNSGWPSQTPTPAPLATWDFIQSTESGFGRYYVRKAEGPEPKTRVISAVWTIFDPVNHVAGLGLTWPSGSDQNVISSEIPLQAVTHKDGIAGLHVHSKPFATGQTFLSYESHVVRRFGYVRKLVIPADSALHVVSADSSGFSSKFQALKSPP